MGILTGESLGICLGIAQFIVFFQFPENADKASEAECLWVLRHEKKIPWLTEQTFWKDFDTVVFIHLPIILFNHI